MYVFVDPKPAAVLGRFNYWQFLLFLAGIAGTLSILPVALVKPTRRKQVCLKITAIWSGLIVGLIMGETIAWFMPGKYQMDNPWYILAGGGVKISDALMWERPSHLEWKGFSRGDLAAKDVDPYGSYIEFKTDFEGFRNSQDIHKAEMIFIGDSYTEAGNLPEEQTFPRLVSRLLNLTTRNLGRAGYSPSSELIVLKKYGLKCKPRIVIWQIAESNELEEEIIFRQWQLQGCPPLLDPKYEVLGKASRIQVWQRYSPSYILFNLLRTPTAWPLEGIFIDQNRQEHPMRFLGLPSRKQLPQGHPGWPLLSESIRQGQAIASAAQIRLVVLLIPMKARIMGHVMRKWIRGQFEPAEDIRRDQSLAHYLASLCHRLGITFIDTSLVLRASAREGEMVYLPFDTHLSFQGHVIIANMIVDALNF